MNNSRDLTLTGSMINGALSSFCTISCCHPLYTIKNFRQAGKGFPRPNFFATVIMQSKPLTTKERIIGGLASGIVASPFLCICDRVVAVQQLQPKDPITKKTLTITQTVRKVLDKEGPKGLVRGLTPTTIRGSINFGCFFGLQESIQLELEKKIESKKLSRYMSFSILGCFAGVINTPVDLIKTNMQATIGDSSSSFEVANKVIKKIGRGPVGLFRGWQPRIALMGTLMPTMAFFSDNVSKALPDSLRANK